MEWAQAVASTLHFRLGKTIRASTSIVSYASSVRSPLLISVPAMIDAVWRNVFERIPEDMRGSIAVVTLTGAELVIQQVYKLERDFMVVRARTAGTMDVGRIIVIAYGQIDYLGFNNKMGEEDVGRLFHDPMPEFAAPAVVYQQAAAPISTPAPYTPRPDTPRPAPATPLPAAVAQAATVPAAAESPAQKPGQISKTILLARLRERLAEKTK